MTNDEITKKPYVSVSILLKGDQLDPDSVSEALGIRPDGSRKKGEKHGGTRPGSKTYVARTGSWRTKCRDAGNVEDIFSDVPRIVGDLLQKFQGRQDPLDKIAGVDEAYLDIFIIEPKNEKSDNTAEFILSKDQILRASQLGLAISVTASIDDDE